MDKNIIKLIILFSIHFGNVWAQSPGFIEYPPGYKPVSKQKQNYQKNKEANQKAKAQAFNGKTGYIQISIESGESFQKLNDINYSGTSFNLALSKYFSSSFSQIRLGKTSLKNDQGSYNKIGFFVGYSPVINENVRPYLALGIQRNSFSQKNNTQLNDFKSYSPSLMFGSSLYSFGKTSLGLKYIYENQSSKEYDNLNNQDFLLDFSFSW